MITIKKPKDIALLQEGGKILSSILAQLVFMSKSGVSTAQIDKKAEELIRQNGGIPAFKNYGASKNIPGFPSTICASVNEQLVHTPASEYKLKDGDVFTIDIGMRYPATCSGLYTDMATTFVVGNPTSEQQKLLDVTRKSLELGIQQVKSGNKISDIGRAVQTYVEQNGFSVVRDLVGHGVGYEIHEDPRVPNYVDDRGKDVELKEGMVIAIEPMVSVGDYTIKTLDDAWTIVMSDGSLCAHEEHTVAVTKDGYKILTK